MHCTARPGGSTARVVFREGVLQSLSDPRFTIPYAPPSLDSLEVLPHSDNTRSSRRQIRIPHLNSGASGRDAWTACQGNWFELWGGSNAAIVHIDGVAVPTFAVGADGTQIEFEVPCGSGSHPRQVWVDVAGQLTCSPNVTACLDMSIAYQQPTVSGVMVPQGEHITTAGGFGN